MTVKQKHDQGLNVALVNSQNTSYISTFASLYHSVEVQYF